MKKVAQVFTIAILFLFAAIANAQWQAVDLYPSGAFGDSQAIGVFANEQVGWVESTASIWNGTAASWQNLGSGFITATDGTQQAGWSSTNGITSFAAIWVNGVRNFLNNPTGAQSSGIYAIYGKTYGGFYVINGETRALYWIRNRTVLLHPSGYVGSLVEAMDKGIQAGRICPVSQTECFAATWRGKATTVKNLHPAEGYIDSNIRGMQGDYAVGWATDASFHMHAGFWDLRTGAFTDANLGAWASGMNAVSGTWAAGAMWPTSTDGPHAFVWDLLNGANSVDLHNVLPAGQYSDSAAFGIWRNSAGTTYVVGMATSTTGLQQHAMLWILP